MERRVINKPSQKTPVVGAENITVKPKGQEERLRDVEGYLQQTDPILRATVNDINGLKAILATLNEEMTKIAGVQARSNSYIEAKFAEINATFGAIVGVIKKIDDDYQALFADEGTSIDGTEVTEQEYIEPESSEVQVIPDVPGEESESYYSDEELYSDGATEPSEPITLPETPKVIDVMPIKAPGKKKK
jgi:hypothetical protein